MKTGQNTVEIVGGSWLVALLAGTLAGVLLWTVGGWGFLQACFIGGIVFVVLGLIISFVMGKPLPAPGEAVIDAAAPGETAAKVEKLAPTVEANKGRIKPSRPLPGEADLAARKPSWSYQAAAPTVQDAIDRDAGTAPVAAPAPAAAAAPAPAATSDAADDLKLIGGVGPALEKKLNDAGIFRFEQIANMGPEEVDAIEEQLSFKGRMQRDDWFGQARTLAAGGDTEFSKKKRKS